MRYYTRITLGALALVLVGCSSPTAPKTESGIVIRTGQKASTQWICPLGNGFVIHTGETPPSPDCTPYGG